MQLKVNSAGSRGLQGLGRGFTDHWPHHAAVVPASCVSKILPSGWGVLSRCSQIVAGVAECYGWGYSKQLIIVEALAFWD